MSTETLETPKTNEPRPFEERESIIVRLAGDSGDGMQLVGGQLTNTSAVFGNDVSTFPDFPAEIRAPAGTLAGVSGFQIHFSSNDIKTPGDDLDALVAMNPAALKVNLKSLRSGGILIVNSEAFGWTDLKKAGYDHNPLDDEQALSKYKVLKVPMQRLNRDAVGKTGLSQKNVDRSKNLFALGLLYWLFDRSMDPTINWIKDKFAKVQEIRDGNIAALKSGYFYGETVEAITHRYRVKPAKIQPGTYRQIMGNQATAYGMVTASKLANKEIVYCSYPITPASDILHELSKLKNFTTITFQAEDEIAAMCGAIGASYAGQLGCTGTSGPGLALKAEAIGLAVMTELPVVVINVQRGGPSTGLPTKTEQADLLQAMYGRNGECPAPVLAASTPSDCFHMAIEAFRIATEFMTPVILLSDGYIANGAEPWSIPKFSDLKPFNIKHPGVNGESNGNGQPFLPYDRNEKMARPWAIPGTKGYEHRIGGLEKEDKTGNVSYDPDNHQKMIGIRAQKVANIANHIPEQEVDGDESGDLLMVSWGGTHGAVSTAVQQMRDKGHSVSHMHLRYMNPMPRNVGDILKRFKKVVVAELNMGQLLMILRSKFLVAAEGYNKVKGLPFLVTELEEVIAKALAK